MTPNQLKTLEHQVTAYMTRITEQAPDPAPFRLKQAHTERVRGHIRKLSGDEGLNGPARGLAEAAALVHDLGRFPQYMIYQTFSDSLSANHAALSAGVICREKLLDRIARHDRQRVLRAVALHNRPCLPPGLPKDLDFLARLLRDADKMDIFTVMVALYEAQNGKKSYITHNLRDDGQIRHDLVAQMMAGNSIAYRQVKSLNDMKLFQLSMVYDLNFPGAMAHVLEQRVVHKILGSLPEAPVLPGLERHLVRYLERGLKNNQSN